MIEAGMLKSGLARCVIEKDTLIELRSPEQ